MSEYWKSTPKYWCKHCKTFVKDTKLEKTNHEATPKHQGNLQRFLRQLHQGHEREEREKQRAKDEVDRLNGMVSGSGAASTGTRKPAIPQSSPANGQATAAERKKQLQQLAEMGIAVPEDFRREMAMAGDWQTTAERAIYDTPVMREGIKEEEGFGAMKEASLNVGVRKRKYEGQEEDEEVGEKVVRKGWGSTTRTYPGAAGEEDDLDALLQNTSEVKRKGGVMAASKWEETGSPAERTSSDLVKPDDASFTTDMPPIKKGDSTAIRSNTDVMPAHTIGEAPVVKQEHGPPRVGVVFKKRKSKTTRPN
ncbi:MAG: hypothetical protein Q9217_001574 [Psora testacea]